MMAHDACVKVAAGVDREPLAPRGRTRGGWSSARRCARLGRIAAIPYPCRSHWLALDGSEASLSCDLFDGSRMPFDVGDKVVYPHHGAATVVRRESRDVFGEQREYLILELAYGDLTLMVPADNTAEVGIRDIINDEEVEEVFAVLRKKEARMPANWSRRFKNHVEKLKSGDVYQVAEVVRNLSLREKDKGLSAGEKRMLQKARQILVSELTFALDVNEEEAERRLNEALV